MTIPQTPAAFLQSLRLRIRALPANVAVVIVEGASDRSVLLPLSCAETLIVVARGKDRLIPAYQELEESLRRRVLFLLDCDGHTPAHLKGNIDLILTQNRDLEADLIFELESINRVVLELLGPRLETNAAATELSARLIASAGHMGTVVGIVLDAARSLGLRTRVNDSRTGQPRKVRPSDLPDLMESLGREESPSAEDVSLEVGQVLSWDNQETQLAQAAVKHAIESASCPHSVIRCYSCWAMRCCNGHHLVDALSQAFNALANVRVDLETLDKLVRMAATAVAHDHWPVLARIRRWEDQAGVMALTGRQVA